MHGTVRAKSATSVLRAARRRTVDPRHPRTRDDASVRPLGFKVIGGLNDPPAPGEAILPLGDTAIDGFAARMAAWLADVAMNDQGAA